MDIEKIKEIYGDSVIALIKQNIDDISINIKYLKKIGFTDIEDIFERYIYIFIDRQISLQKKMNDKNFEYAKSLIPATYVNQGRDAIKRRENLVKDLLTHRKIPEIGWDDQSIEQKTSPLDFCLDSS